MKNLFLILLGLLGLHSQLRAHDWADHFIIGTPEIHSMSQLAFGPEGILFIGDSKKAKIIAIALDSKTEAKPEKRSDIQNVEGKIAALLGTSTENILIHDMAIHPQSEAIYFAISREGKPQEDTYWKLPNDVADASILIKMDAAGKLSPVSLENVKYSESALPNPVESDEKYWRGDARVDVISDLSYKNGKLFVAGLSNEEFAATLRILPFPFGGEIQSNSVEIYHGAHGKYETEAPIRAFLPYESKGEEYLFAAYTCTPLVTFSVADLQSKKHVKGRTVAELGMWNMPLDMILIHQGEEDYILMANSSRSLMKISVQDIQNYEGSIQEKVARFETKGVAYTTIPLWVQQLDKLNERTIAMLMRMPNGTLNLNFLAVDRI